MNTPEPNELWTTDQVAQHLGYTGPSAAGSARRTLSRLGVKAVQHRPTGPGRRVHALYNAQQVTAAVAARPGQGARTAPALKEIPANGTTIRQLLADALAATKVVISGPEGDFEYPAELVVALAGALAGTPTLRTFFLDYQLEVESVDQTEIIVRAGFSHRYEARVDGTVIMLCAETECEEILPNPAQQSWCTEHTDVGLLDRHLASTAVWIAGQRDELRQLENRTRADAAARDAGDVL